MLTARAFLLLLLIRHSSFVLRHFNIPYES
jgi:hypothetical protein